MKTKQLFLSLLLFWMVAACHSPSPETREIPPYPDKDLQEKHEQQQDSVRNQEVQKIPMH